MPYQPHNWWKLQDRTCERPGCGKSYRPTAWNQRYCCVECKLAVAMAEFKSRNPEYWQKYRDDRKRNNKRRPDSLKPPYNPKPCLLCKRPLGRTFNEFYHTRCHSRISKVYGETDVAYDVGGRRVSHTNME